ncbi:ATP-binding protein [Ideonella sp. A 288]|uniref:sensor histidine kinase n=1 Tax=Ideonella sp. A 288 TaxID=1962181 RepID=UPI001F1C0012|nr:ATP-binding protein [Ideonella sp. A 288]
MPLTLAAAAIVAAMLATHAALPGVLAGLALVLTAAACTAAGALWHRQKVADRLADARQQQHLLMQLSDAWVWQTDSQHRLVRWQPPLGAPASSWAGGAFSGELLWDRFVDAEGALAGRLQAQAQVPDTTVAATQGTGATWRMRGLPRLDSQGRFAGHLGVARPEPTAVAMAAVVEAPAPAPAAPSGQPDAATLADEHAAFTYTVSHDLRAPLRVVEGFGRILKEDYGHVLDRIGNDHLDRMVAAAARMNHMIDSLLALSKLSMQPLLRQPVDLSQLAKYVVDDLRSGAPERSVAVRIQPGLGVQGDPTLLRMVLDNLLGNAWKYSSRRADAEIGFEQTVQDGRPVFVVHDNGAGFDMRFADRLFGVFQRLHSSSEFQGSGVGLASVRRIVRRHGGEIWAEAEVGRGARFYFTLGG